LPPVFSEKHGVFLENQSYDQHFAKTSRTLNKTRKFFGQIITSVPRPNRTCHFLHVTLVSSVTITFNRVTRFFSYIFSEENSAKIFLPKKCCGNNGQGDPVDNLYSKWVKSTLTGHKQKHLHSYQINGRSRLGSSGADPIQFETRISNNFVWNRKLIGGKMNGTKNMIK
jgi:hypothetical protein